MKKVKKASGRKLGERVLGIAASNTTKGKILNELLDGKYHTMESLTELRQKPDESIGWRLTMLKNAGKRATRPFRIEIDGDKVRLSYTGKASKNSSSPAKTERHKTTKKAKSNGGSGRATVQDVPVEDED